MPQPLAAAPAALLAPLRYVLTDIDDTLTTEGRLPARAYAALEALDSRSRLDARYRRLRSYGAYEAA